ncbi:MAG: DUF11 domain-containing protein [Myxococcales bacterium]|nr:DUF11 domain-containing protein [Myxococcales bacterium]
MDSLTKKAMSLMATATWRQHTMARFAWWLLTCLMIFHSSPAHAGVQGQPPAILATYKLFGSAAVTGNTMMSASPPGNVNDILLPQNSAQISGIPFDGEVEAAYLWWTGTVNGTADTSVDFTLPNGSRVPVSSTTCQTVSRVLGNLDFFYCRAEITSVVKQLGTGNSLNGNYTVSGLNALPGDCNTNQFCQANYAAWSMAVVWKSPTTTVRRDIVLYDGFLMMDEEQNPPSSGITNFRITGFRVGDPPEGTFTFFGLEGDQFLGSPPEASTNGDFISFRSQSATQSTKLESSTPYNPPGNVWNSTLALGVDLDTFEIGRRGQNLLKPGDTFADLSLGTGDGIACPGGACGDGELVFLGFIVLSIDTLTPNFRNTRTRKRVDRGNAGVGDILTYTIDIVNTGSLAAQNTIVRDAIPANTTYIPGSTRVDGQPRPDVGGTSPLVNGLNLGTINFQGDNDREITFQVRITGTPANRQIENFFTVQSDEVGPTQSNTAITTIQAPQLGQLTKRFENLTRPGASDVRPGEQLRYTIVGQNSGSATASGIQYVDNLPPFVKLDANSVIPPAGTNPADNRSSATGGTNGTGLIDIRNITIPANFTAEIRYTVTVFTEAEFNTAGIAIDKIHGTRLSNQGEARQSLAGITLKTDDPNTPPRNDPTVVIINYKPDFSSSTKTVTDDNGGRPEPSDVLTYTVTLRNTGSRNTTVRWEDNLPKGVTNYQQVTMPAGSQPQFQAAPAGANQTGLLTVRNIALNVGATAQIVFRVTIDPNIANGETIANVGDVIDEKDNSRQTLSSQSLTVIAGPELSRSTKAVVDTNGGQVEPGDTLTYTITLRNTGNRPATNVVVTDAIDTNLDNIVPANGGSFAGNTITWNNTSTPALASIAPNATVILTFTARIKAGTADGTVIPNQGTIQAPNLGGIQRTDDPSTPVLGDATVIRVVAKPNLVATKTVTDNNGGQPAPGDILTYTITLRNTGSSPATDVVVGDTIDTNLINVTPAQGGTLTGGAIVWNKTTTPTLGSIASNATVTLTFTAQIRTPLPNGTVINNQARVTGGNFTDLLSDDPTTPTPNDPTRVTVQSQAVATFTKEVRDTNGGDVVPGDILIYTLTLRVAGSSPYRNVVITDAVPAQLTQIQPGNGGTLAGNTITWNPTNTPALANLNPNDEIRLTFTARVQANLPDGTVIANQASVNATGIPAQNSDDPSTPTPADPTRITVRSRPDLTTSTKEVRDVNGGQLLPGETVSYTIAVKNTGNVAATNVVITDVVDANLENIVPANGGVLAGNTITWNLPSVINGAEVRLTFTARVKSPIPDKTKISNQANIRADNATATVTDDPNTPAADDPTVIEVTSGPSFANTTKEVTDNNGGQVEPGDTLTYTITVRNNGTSAGTNVVVRDTIDTAKINQITPGQGGVFAGGVVTWNAASTPALASIPVGGSVTLTFTAVVLSNVPNGTIIENQAFVTATGITTPEPSDDPRTADDNDSTKVTVVAGPTLTDSTKTVRDNNGGTPEPGDFLTYTLTIRNTGKGAALNVVVRDPVDVNNLLNIIPSQGGVLNGGTINWDGNTTAGLRNIAPGGSVTLSFTAQIAQGVPSGTRILNQATMTAQGLASPTPTDDPNTPTLDDPTAIVVGGQPILTATKTAQDTNGGDPAPGDSITYTITVRNTGTQAATNVVVNDPVDTNTLENIVPANGGVFDANTGRILWTIPTIPASGTRQVTFTARIKAGLADNTRISNQAQVSADQVATPIQTDDPNTPASNDPTILIVRSTTRLTFTKDALDVNGGSYRPGDIVRYTINLSNTGTSNVDQVTVTDVVDANLEIVRALNNGQVTGNTITWSPAQVPALAQLKPGDQTQVVFEARIRAGVPDGTRIPNQARANNNNGTLSLLSDDRNTPAPNDPTIILVAFPDISASTKEVRDVNGGTAEPGDDLEYTIRVRNTSNTPVTNVVVTDPIDGNLDNIRPGNGGTLAGNIITWNSTTTPALARINAQSEVLLTVRARVRAGTNDGTVISNQATIRSTETTSDVLTDDPNTPAVDDPTRITIQSAPNLSSFTKSVSGTTNGVASPGAQLTYTITVQNTGSQAANSVDVRDPVPAGLINIIPGQGGTVVNGEIAWNLPSIGPGQTRQLTFTATVDPNTANGTNIDNQARVTSREISTPQLSDDPATPTPRDPTRVTVQASALLVATKTVRDENGGQVEVNDVLTYTITVRNRGSLNAQQLQLIDATPANTTYIAGSTRLNSQQVPDDGVNNPLAAGILIQSARSGTQPGVLLPDDGAPPNDEAATITFQVRVNQGTANGTIISNQGRLSGINVPPLRTDNPDTPVANDSTDVVVGGGPNLTATLKSVRIAEDSGTPNVADVNDVLEYTILIRNTGNAPATTLRFEDEIPENTLYIGSSITLNGQAQTDAADNDSGDFRSGVGARGTVFVNIASLAASQQARITFRVRITGGTRISNQGFVQAANFPREGTDADDNDSNGDQPTIIPVGTQSLLTGIKEVVDLNGGEANPGDILEYRITVRNSGQVELSGIEVRDVVPANTTYRNNSAQGPGTNTFDANSRTVIFSGITLAPNQTALLIFQVLISANAAAGTVIRNKATLTAQPNISEETNEVQTTIQSGGGTASIQGLIYQEIGTNNTYDANTDEILGGFQVRAYRSDNLQTPVRSATADDQGNYRLANLPNSTYKIRVYSEKNVQFEEFDVDLSSGGNITRNLEVSPTGRVYQSDNGNYIEDARVFIVYNDLGNTICRRDSDCGASGLCIRDKAGDREGRCGQQVSANDLPENQQGQPTNRRGMYKFSPPISTERSYRIAVRSPIPTLVFPSSRVAPEAGIASFATFTDAGKIIAQDRPNPGNTNQPKTYFTRFSVTKANEVIQNNHLPLDSFDSLIILSKTASLKVATIGDIITYTIKVENRSPVDLNYDPNKKTGGIYISDVLPAGFNLLPLSPRVKRSDGREILAEANTSRKNGQSITPTRLMKFGPYDLPGLTDITLRYQVAVSRGLPVGSYVNIAYVQNEAGGSISEQARAVVQITHDPIFDQGTVLGKVFCDKNGNRWQNVDDIGIGGVRIYLDNGHYAETDETGKFHIQAIDPGNHMLKLDVQTLPPGSKMIDTPDRIFYISRGLFRKINFAVKCNNVTANVQKVFLRKKIIPKPKPKPIRLSGSVYGPRLEINGKPRPLPVVDMALTADKDHVPNFESEQGIDLELRGKRLAKSVAFHLRIAEGARPERWRLDIYEKGQGKKMGLLLRTMKGVGTPPTTLEWKGDSNAGVFVLRERKLYMAQFKLITLDDTISQSPPRIFGVNVTKRPRKVLFNQRFPATWMGRRGIRVRGRLRSRLRRRAFRKKLQKLMEQKGTRLEVHVHHDNGIPRQRALFLTVRRAVAIERYLQQLLKIPASRVVSRGFGSSRPLLPNISRRNKRRNLRIDIRVTEEQTSAGNAIPGLSYDPLVQVEQLSIPINTSGKFEHVLKPPFIKELRLQITTPRGSRVDLPVVIIKKKTKIPGDKKPKNSKPLKGKKDPLAWFKKRDVVSKRKSLILHPSQIFNKKRFLLEFQDPNRNSLLSNNDQPTFRLYLSANKVERLSTSSEDNENGRRGKTLRVAQADPKAKVVEPKKVAPKKVAPKKVAPKTSAKTTKASAKAKKPKGPKKPKTKLVEIPLDQAKDVAASKLRVTLPPQGSVIHTENFLLTGYTEPGNKVFANGQEAKVSEKGAFKVKVKLKHGQQKLQIYAEDKEGNRGEINWPVKVDLNRLFMLALADLTFGTQNTQLEGLESIASFQGSGVMIHGRAVFYAKGQIQGKHLLSAVFKNIKYTAYVETPKRREVLEFYQQLIDPDRYYPVYGDSGKQVQDVQTRGWGFKVGDQAYRMPLYVMVQADRSRLVAGNFRTKLRGIEIIRYDRTVHGVDIDFRKRFAKHFDTRARVFVSDGQQQQLKAHIQMRGTGGSLYYLPHQNVLEGSEQIRLTIRDKDSGIILQQIPLTRYEDYNVQYFEGRIFFKHPVSSVADSFLLTQHGLFSTLDGNPLYIEADYEYENTDGQNGLTVGVQVSQALWDKIKVGFSFVQENRAAGTTPAYQLWGFDLTARWNKNTYLQAEYARSMSFDSQSFFSDDGGLTFRALQGFHNNQQFSGLLGQQQSTSGTPFEGNAVAVRLNSDIGELTKWKNVELITSAYFSHRDRDFFASGQAPEQGTTKGGAVARLKLFKKHQIQLKYDGGIGLQFDPTTNQSYDYIKHLFNLQYAFFINKSWDVVVEYSHTQDFDGLRRLELWGNFVTLGGSWKVNKYVQLLLRQQMAFATQTIAPLTVMDHFATTLGVNLKLFDTDTYATVAGTLRWSGNHSAQIGLKTKLNETSSAYIREELTYQQFSTGLVNTVVVGAEQKISRNARVYGEYQLDSGVSNQNSRAVVGLNHVFEFFKGVFLGAGFERAMFLDPRAGASGRTVGRLTFQLTRWKNIKASGRYELRYDENNPALNTGDKIQFVTLNNVTWQFTQDVAFLVRLNYALTHNFSLDNGAGGTEGELLEFSAGLAYRPVRFDWVSVLLKYTLRQEQRPLGLTGTGENQRSTTEVFSLVPIFELPFRLQIVEQFNVKFRREEVAGLQPASTATILWINRLNFHLINKLDIGVEYRLMWQWQGSGGEALRQSTFDHGFLLEAAYNIHRFAYVGVGYNFTRFSDNLFLDDTRDYSGFFIRAVGKF